MKTIKFIALLGICVFISSCEKENSTPEQFEVPLGQEFSIELESNWSTGYHWVWINEGVVAVVDSAGITFLPEGSLLGESGIEKWKFKSILEGEETLMFEYQSPQGTDSNAPIIEEFLICVY